MITFDEAKIRDVADVKGGKRLPKGKQLLTTPNNHPYIRIRDLGKSKTLELNSDYEYVDSLTQESIKRYIVSEGDILISVVGTIGLIGIVGKSLHGANQTENCDKITNLKRIDRDYLYYYLISDLGQNEIKKGTVGAVQPKLPLKNVLDLKIKYPDIDTQRKIAKILNLIDEKITINSEINDNLMQQGTSLFNEYLVKFDDVPNNWKVSSLDRIADYINGLAMQKYPPKDNEEGLPVLKIAELKQGCCDSNGDRCTSQLDEDYIINDGDVIFSWSASLVVDLWCGGKAGLNQHLFNVKSNIYDKWFYFWWTKYHLNEFIHEASSKATTMGHIKRDNLSKAKVLIPSKNDYEAIGHLLKPITDSIVNVKLENKRLSALRDSLLPKLMSGEIDVHSIEL